MFLDNLQYRNYEDLNRLIHQADLHAFRDADLVVGIPRSGMVPAFMIGLLLNLPVIDIESYVAGVEPFVGNRPIRNKREFKLESHGPWHQEVHSFGFNYRLPDVLCAIGISQIKKLSEFKVKRNKIFDF
jgi:hypothetical protein